MLLFTSNSNNQALTTKWKRTWLLSVLILILFIIVWNAFWVSRGITPASEDNPELWMYYRKRASWQKENSVVLIGASQMQTGIDPDVFEQYTGKRPIQLAIAGQSFLPVLSSLAEDESFRGTVISDFLEQFSYTNEVYGSQSLSFGGYNVDNWIKEYKQNPPNNDLEIKLKGIVNSLIVNPHLGNNASDSFNNILSGRLFKKTIYDAYAQREIRVSFDRRIFMDFNQLSENEINEMHSKILSINRQYESKPPKPEILAEIINKTDLCVKQIEARGGKVIFVHFPMGDEMMEQTERFFPRKDFWDKVLSRTSSKGIHFLDYPNLAIIKPSDGLHLDYRNSTLFTRELINILNDQK